MAFLTNWIRYGEQERYSGFLAVPERASGPLPAIIVLQEIWGVDDHIQDVTKRFASAGYAAFAPDLYAESGVRKPGLEAEGIKLAQQFLDTLSPAEWRSQEARAAALATRPAEEQKQIGGTLQQLFGGTANLGSHLETILAAAVYLRESLPLTRGAKIGAVGFCMGGALSAQLASRDPDLSAAVIYYGNAPSKDQIADIRCPLLGMYGETDERITGQVPDFAASMEQQGKSFEYHIYAGAPHAFFNDNRVSYRADAARDAFVRTLSFFADHIG